MISVFQLIIECVIPLVISCLQLCTIVCVVKCLHPLSKRMADLEQKWFELSLCQESLIDEIELLKMGGDQE